MFLPYTCLRRPAESCREGDQSRPAFRNVALRAHAGAGGPDLHLSGSRPGRRALPCQPCRRLLFVACPGFRRSKNEPEQHTRVCCMTLSPLFLLFSAGYSLHRLCLHYLPRCRPALAGRQGRSVGRCWLLCKWAHNHPRSRFLLFQFGISFSKQTIQRLSTLFHFLALSFFTCLHFGTRPG